MVKPAEIKDKRLKFKRYDKNDFYAVLKKRVENYFTENKLSIHAPCYVYVKATIFALIYVLLYAAILSDNFGLWGLIILFGLLGVCKGLIGFNIIHDSLHNALTPYKSVNMALGYWFDLNGTSSYIWKISHNVHHHVYTNIPGHDDDINKASVLRLNSTDKVLWFHRFQNWYAPVLYSLIGFNWVFYSDFAWMFAASKRKSVALSDVLIMIAFKFINITLFLVLPLTLLSVPWWYIALSYLSMHIFGGITISIIFQLAHIVDNVSYHEPDNDGNMEHNWALHEMLTTSNFATNNRFLTELIGGLNFQIEHHLFPQINHSHYPAISKIVKETAVEYNCPYYEQPTLFTAIKSHFRTLYQLGVGAK